MTSTVTGTQTTVVDATPKAKTEEVCEICQMISGESSDKKESQTQSSAVGDKKQHANDVDIFRDTPVRLLGYANEVGEAFRSLVHVNWVKLSYAVACTYVLADANDKKNRAGEQKWSSEEERSMMQRRAVIDTILWQGLASVIIPGFTINRVCWATGHLLRLAAPSMRTTVRKAAVTSTGLLAIPFIVKPIDYSVDYAMEHTYRKYANPPPKDTIVHHTRND